MTTAQDQQSRELLPCPFCGSTPTFSPPEWCDDRRYVGMELECCVTMTEGIGWRTARDMTEAEHRDELQKKLADTWNRRALPAGDDALLPIAAKSNGAWDGLEELLAVPDGTAVYTAAQVLAMLAQGLAPGWQAVPVEPSGDMLVAIMSAGEVDVLRETPEKHQVLLIDRAGIPERYANLLAAAPQPPAAPATTEPPAPTTGAGSSTAGAAPAYRLLQRDIDTIQADDEFLRDDAVTWQADPQGIFVGMTYMSNVLRPARRAIEPAP